MLYPDSVNLDPQHCFGRFESLINPPMSSMPDERVSGHGGEHPEGQHGQGPAAPPLQPEESSVLQAQNIRSTIL